MLKKILLGIVILIALVVATFMIIILPGYHKFMTTESIQFDKSLTLILGGGGNSGILVTDSAVVVIDTKMGKPAKLLAETVKKIAGKKKIIVINTHFHPDHSGGNQYYSGCKIISGSYDLAFLQQHLKVGQIPNTFVADSLMLALGTDTLMLYNLGQAHTWDDVIVYVKNRKLLFSGDLVVNKINPVLNKESGAHVGKWIQALDNILRRDIKVLVPGHGKPGGKELANDLLHYFEDMRTAALEPEKEAAMKAKYTKWFGMPFMSSTNNTIKYIKESK